MGGSVKQLSINIWLGRIPVLLILILTLGTLLAVIKEATAFHVLTSGDWSAVRFTVKQALLSAFFSCAISIPIARALARRNFTGKNLIVSLLGAPFILPVLIAILGLVFIFGNNGFINNTLTALNLPKISIYGLHGIVIAHVFFNLPLAVRLIFQSWLSVPSERFRLSAQLGLNSFEIFKYLELPMLKNILPGIFVTIFLICMTSFAVALALGGGPKATTIELAIYQAFRFDFNLSKAALLALIQFFLCLVITSLTIKFSISSYFGSGLDRSIDRWDAQTFTAKLLDILLIISVSLFIFIPILTIFLKGLPNILTLPNIVWFSAGRSIIMALISAFVTITMALGLCLCISETKSKQSFVYEISGYLTIAASPMVMGTGLFIIIMPLTDPKSLALVVTVLVNSAMSLPFAIRILLPPLKIIINDYQNLSESLGMSNWSNLKYVVLPRLSLPLGFSTGLAAAIAMGDFGVIALFSDPEKSTLPMVLYSLLSSYRLDLAASTATLLLCLTFGVFWFFDKIGRLNARS